VTLWSELSSVAGVSTAMPSIAIRRSTIIRSISRRDAMPARASSFRDASPSWRVARSGRSWLAGGAGRRAGGAAGGGH
jgi:hypothetical protein